MVDNNDITRYDNEKIYCPMLGHHVPFSYCREPGNRLFCSRITACWKEKIDISSFLTAHFTSEQIQAAMTPPKPKVASLIDLIARAQKR